MDYKEYLQLDNVFTSPFRSIAWTIIKGLMEFLNSVQQIVLDVFDFSGIFQNEYMQQFLTTYSTVAWAIGTLALVLWGLRYMYDDRVRIKTLFDSFLLGLGTLLLGTLIIGNLTTVGIQIAESFLTNDQNNSFAYEVLNSNTIDMYRVLNDGVDPKQANSNINETNIHYIDINETLKKDDLNDKVAQKAIEHKVHMQTDGSLALKKVNDYLFIGIEQNYSRYVFNGWVIVFFLITSILAYILTAFKFVQLMFEIVYNQTLLPLFAFSDLNGAKILKMILNNIKNAIISMIMISMVLKAYYIAQVFLVSLDIGVFTQIIIQFALAISVIDGPKIAQEVTGNDAGLKSTGLAMFGVAKGAGSAITGMSKGGNTLGNIGKSIGSKAMDLGVGMNNLKRDNDAINASSTQTKSSSNGSPNDRDKEIQSEMRNSPLGTQHTMSGNESHTGSTPNNTQPVKSAEKEPLSVHKQRGSNSVPNIQKPTTQANSGMANNSNLGVGLGSNKQDKGSSIKDEKPLSSQQHLQADIGKSLSGKDTDLSQSAKRSIGSSPNVPIAPNVGQEVARGNLTNQIVNPNQIPSTNINSKTEKSTQQDTTTSQGSHPNQKKSEKQLNTNSIKGMEEQRKHNEILSEAMDERNI